MWILVLQPHTVIHVGVSLRECCPNMCPSFVWNLLATLTMARTHGRSKPSVQILCYEVGKPVMETQACSQDVIQKRYKWSRTRFLVQLVAEVPMQLCVSVARAATHHPKPATPCDAKSNQQCNGIVQVFALDCGYISSML
jgi:hypothetical protein